MAKKVYTSIKSQIEKSSLSIIASASNILQRIWWKKIETILKSAPDIITSKYTLEENRNSKNIDSMASKTYAI